MHRKSCVTLRCDFSARQSVDIVVILPGGWMAALRLDINKVMSRHSGWWCPTMTSSWTQTLHQHPSLSDEQLTEQCSLVFVCLCVCVQRWSRFVADGFNVWQRSHAAELLKVSCLAT